MLILTSSTTVTKTSGRVHILASWDLSTSTTHFFINGIDEKEPGTTFVNNNIDWTRFQHYIGISNYGQEFRPASAGYVSKTIASMMYFALLVFTNLLPFLTSVCTECY